MPDTADVVAHYLRGPGPHRLEVGAGTTARPGWLATDLKARENPDGSRVLGLDASKAFPIPSGSFDFVYAEHMIEHLGFEDGQVMLRECNRILKPGGVIRVVTPSLGFLLRVVAADPSVFEQRYRHWSVKTFVPEAPAVTNAFFLNNFVRAWGHTFIYDRETLALALHLTGFQQITACDLNASNHLALRDLENLRRLPPGFLELESMVLEGSR